VTEVTREENLERKKILEAAASAAGHEMRNALNGLLVNLEVVRSMAQASGFAAEPFMSQSLMQSEESVRLAEAAIAMLKLMAGAMGNDGGVSRASADPRQIAIEAGAAAGRLSEALKPLADRGVLSVETSGSAVILRIPEESPNLNTE
jgi:hypothetical protein